jgi:hypothetical protein
MRSGISLLLTANLAPWTKCPGVWAPMPIVRMAVKTKPSFAGVDRESFWLRVCRPVDGETYLIAPWNLRSPGERRSQRLQCRRPSRPCLALDRAFDLVQALRGSRRHTRLPAQAAFCSVCNSIPIAGRKPHCRRRFCDRRSARRCPHKARRALRQRILHRFQVSRK